MLAISCGGNHCAYVFGMLHQLFVEDPTCDWKELAGNSSGALICAGVAQTRNNSEYINMIDRLYSTMCKKDIAEEWSGARSDLSSTTYTPFFFTTPCTKTP